MIHPVEPEMYHSGDNSISIGLSYAAESDFSDIVTNQLKGQGDPEQSIVHFSINSAELDVAKSVFNNTKFRNIDNANDYIKKLFSNLISEIDSFREINLSISYDDKSLEDMSPGMQAQALLKIFLDDQLKTGKFDYIVLDQPEDNLDIPTISEILVKRIKDIKPHTQVFVISHSAPVIINGDSRRIIISNSDKETIRYKCGATNESESKQEIAKVLDGGELYLKMRMNKYNYQMEDHYDND